MKTGNHRIRVREPHPSSLAALVLLNRKCGRMEFEKWLKFRYEIFDRDAPDGNLKCAYCGAERLVRDMDEEADTAPWNLATVDHVMPVSKGGMMYDGKNCVVACYRCNQKKKDNVPGWLSGESDSIVNCRSNPSQVRILSPAPNFI